MAGKPDPKLKILLIKDLLERASDEVKGVTASEISDHLASMGLSAERKSIYADIDTLRRYGMDIAAVRRNGRTEYRLMSRTFQLPELKLLVDAVGASKFITRKKSLELIKKLSSLASERESRELRRSIYVERRVKTMNESIYYTVDAIHAAINANKKLEFQYFDYTPAKKRALRRGGEKYVVSPLSLNYAEENYYLFGYNSASGGIRTYRVDRMLEAAALDDMRDVNDITRAFDPAASSREMFSMYSGELRSLTLRFDDRLSTVAIDRFGEDASIRPLEGGGFALTADVMVSPNFFGWIFSLDGRAEILSPDDVREKYRDFARRALGD